MKTSFDFFNHQANRGIRIYGNLIKLEKQWEKRFQRYNDRLKFEENISFSKSHLDFGCEYGTFPKILAEKYPNVQVYGIDFDEEKIEIGKSRYQLPNLVLLHSNEIIGTYDSITAILTLHEISDAIKTLEAFYSQLNDDGRIMIYEFRKTSKEKYKEWFEKGRPNRVFEEEYQKHNRWTVKEFEQMCEKIGFKTIKAEPCRDYWLIYIGKK